MNGDLQNILKELMPGGTMSKVVTEMVPGPNIVPVLNTALDTIVNCDTDLVVDGENCMKEPMFTGDVCPGANAFDPSKPAKELVKPTVQDSEPAKEPVKPKVQDPEPTNEPSPKVCCQAQTKECMACNMGISEEEFCQQPSHVGQFGCDGEVSKKEEPEKVEAEKEEPKKEEPKKEEPKKEEPKKECVELDVSKVSGCPAKKFYGTVSSSKGQHSVVQAMEKLYSLVPMIKMIVQVGDACLDVLKTELCTLAFPSCSARCTARLACSSSVSKIKKECGIFATKDVLGAIMPGGAMESMAQGMVGKESLPVLQDLVKLLLGDGELDDNDKTCASSSTALDSCMHGEMPVVFRI
jgi:hypothetical protein